MTEQEVFGTVARLIAEKFDYAGPITGTTVAQDVDGWDSVAHVELILDLEDHFGIRLTTGETADLPDVGALAAAVSRHVARRRA